MKRNNFLKLCGLGLAGIPVSSLIGKSNGFDVIKMEQKPSCKITYGIVGQWNDVANKYHLYSSQYPPVLKDGNTMHHFDFGNNNVILRAGIVCNKDGSELACYWGELGEIEARRIIKEGCGYEKHG